MSTRTSSNYKKISIIIVLILVMVGIQYYFYIKNNGSSLLPDDFMGSTSTWSTKNDIKNNATFKYPAQLPSIYTLAVDWPPILNVYKSPLVCTPAGSSIDRAGVTEKHSVNGREYCVTKVSEGAAGSTYNQYAYAFEKENKVLILTFTTKSPQCANYDGFQKEDCEEEKTTFSLDIIVDAIARSIKFN